MQSNVTGFLNRYDIFGKSIPGAMLIVGIYLHLPNLILEDRLPGVNDIQIIDLLGLVFLVLAGGLLVGEAVHTFSRMLQSLVRKVVRFTIGLFRKCRSKSDDVEEGADNDSDEFQPDTNNKSEKSGTGHGIEDNWSSKNNGQMAKVYWWGVWLLKDHRELFSKSIVWNYTERGPWKINQRKEVYDSFSQICDEQYDINPKKELEYKEEEKPTKSAERFLEIYPLVTATVGQHNTKLSQRFQDLYSFTRSMWTVFFIISLLYMLSYLPASGIDSILSGLLPSCISTILSSLWTPIGLLLWTPELFDQSTSPLSYLIIFFALIGVTLIFMHATVRYKRIYIEYLISEYIVAVPEANKDGKEEHKDEKEE